MFRFIFRALFLLAISIAASAQAAVFSSFNPDRQDRFACQISSHLNEYLVKNGLSYESELRKIKFDLENEISTWASVLNYDQALIGRSKILFSDYDYFLQNAFIDLGRTNVDQLPDENWFGAYAFLSAKSETQFRLGEIKNYNLSADLNLKERISAYLEQTKNLKWPSYLDENGKLKQAIFNCRSSWKYGTICSSADTSPPGDPQHPQYPKWIKVAQSANLIASPLFLWILSQPNGSITIESLFKRATAEYKNPFVALGVITWMMMVDAEMGHRERGALLSKRIEPIAYTSDLSGDNYHFWGFLLKTLYGEGTKYRIMSFVHERVIQGDISDWLIDDLAISFGNRVLERISNPKLCAENSKSIPRTGN